jgi:hypothetical protein
MSLRTDARFAFGLAFVRFMPLNDDLTLPLLTAVDLAGKGYLIGGAGPFDVSGVDSSDAIPIYSKIDNGAEETNYVDLSGAVDTAAVTAAEMRDALTAATITGATFDLEPVTGRVRCLFATGDYHQLYGLAARIALFGQGLGIRFYKLDTGQSFTEVATMKDEETITQTDSRGRDNEVITDGYRKGWSGVLVDTAEDFEIAELMEGGTYDEDEDTYEAPTSESNKKYFFVETFYYRYEEGSNLEANFAEYVRKLHRYCKATSLGDRSHAREWSNVTYNIKGTAYKDDAGTLWGDTLKQVLTVVEYEALDVFNV